MDLCSVNVTLDKPEQSLRINFDVPPTYGLPFASTLNCTSYVIWEGDPDTRLWPHVTEMRGFTVTNSSPVVLNILDMNGKVIKLDFYGSLAFYLTLTPVQSKLFQKFVVWRQTFTFFF